MPTAADVPPVPPVEAPDPATSFAMMPVLPASPEVQSFEACVEDWLVYYTERAAFLEHDGGCTRQEAEARALDEIKQLLQWSRNVDFWTKFHTALNAQRREAA